MQEENIFILSEQQDIELMRPPGHGNNCHGHKQSIKAGGNGHWYGDSCGCDSLSPSVSINNYIPLLILIAIIIIFKYIKKRK